MMSTPSRIADRLSSSVVLSWPTVTVVTVVAIVGELAGAPALWGTPWVPRLGALLAAQVALFVVITVWRPVIAAAQDSRTRLGLSLASFVTAAAVQGVVAGQLYVAFGISDSAGLAVRVPTTVWFLTTVLCVVAIGGDVIREQHETVAALVAERDNLQRLRSGARRRVLLQTEMWNRTIQQQIVDELVAVSPQSGASARVEFERIAEDLVRPLSHELAQFTPEVAEAPQAPNSREMLARWIRDLTEPPWLNVAAFATVTAWLMFGLSLSLFTVPRALLITVATGLTSAVLGWIANVVIAHCRKSWGVAAATAAVVPMLVMLVVGLGWVMHAIADDWRYGETVEWAAGVAGVVAVIMMAAKSVRGRNLRVREELAELRWQIRWEITRQREELWTRNQMLARALHGHVQSALLAAAMRLAKPSNRSDPKAITESKQTVLSALEGMTDANAVTLETMCDRVANTWEGLCRIEFELAPDAMAAVDSDPVAQQMAGEIIVEACSNAVRHAHAQHIQVSVIRGHERDLLIKVGDDGSTATTQDAPTQVKATGTNHVSATDESTQPRIAQPRRVTGLGTEMLNSLCLSWSLQLSGTGGVLECRIPLQPGRPDQPEAPK